VSRRIFVAVDLPPEARHLLAARLDDLLGGRAVPGKPVPPENWHVTLRFVGWADDPDVDRFTAGLAEARWGSGFRLRLGGLGAFPRPRRATVLWAGFDRGAERLDQLAAVAEETAHEAGFAPEDRPFHAHLTLSRIRPDQDVTPLVEGVPALGVGFEVRWITLFESVLGRGGPRYHELERFPILGYEQAFD
jgi:RNA 2',3'-cyclic 3'-phosphodiesterase